jgi:hypothetical protein
MFSSQSPPNFVKKEETLLFFTQEHYSSVYDRFYKIDPHSFQAGGDPPVNISPLGPTSMLMQLPFNFLQGIQISQCTIQSDVIVSIRMGKEAKFNNLWREKKSYFVCTDR